jgi:cyanophycin synthetase
LELLRRQQLSLHAVPALGQRVRLSDTANISQGGSAIDLTDAIHPDNRRMAEDVAQLLGVDVIGLDVISQDLKRSWREGQTWLLEANLSPGLRPHLVADPQTDLCHCLVRQWMGEPEDTRVPTVLITGSIGKTTTTRLLAHLLEGLDWTVGITSTTGLELGRTVLAEGDCAGGMGIQHLLTDPRTDAVVAEVARGGLQKIGLVVHEADLGVVLNVLDNHIGQDGIRSRQDLLRIKSLVARAATKALILNLDDPLVMEMALLTRAPQLILISEEDSPNASRFRSHIEAGGSGALWKDGTQGRVRLFWDGAELSRFPVADWDNLTGGLVRGQVVAAAFALASAHWLGVPHSLCRRGLASFGSEPHHNPGRFQTLCTTPFHVVLCFASTSEALRDIGIWARCHVATVGRRHILLRGGAAWPDSRLKAFGNIAAQYFDVVVCARSENLFGRKPNEVQELLRLGALEAESGCEIHHADGDLASLPGFLKAGKDGDLLIALCLDASQAARVIVSWLDQHQVAC